MTQQPRIAGGRRDGIALIMAVLVLSILMALVIQFTYSSAVSSQVAANAAMGARSRYLLRGTRAVVEAYLAQQDAAANGVYALADAESKDRVEGRSGGTGAPGEFQVTRVDLNKDRKGLEQQYGVRLHKQDEVQGSDRESIKADSDWLVVDEDRRLNIYVLAGPDECAAVAEGVLARLLENLSRMQAVDLGGKTSEELAKAIREFVKQEVGGDGSAPPPPAGDTGPAPGPSPDGQGADQGPCKDLDLAALYKPGFGLHRLLAMPELSWDMLYGPSDRASDLPALADFLTVWGSGFLNVNTAPPLLLRSLTPKMEDAQVDAFVRHREQSPYKEAKELVDEAPQAFVEDPETDPEGGTPQNPPDPNDPQAANPNEPPKILHLLNVQSTGFVVDVYTSFVSEDKKSGQQITLLRQRARAVLELRSENQVVSRWWQEVLPERVVARGGRR